jgi:CheY-like chemotaxis protein
LVEDRPVSVLPAGRYLKISVADRGAGIAEEVVSKIFDPYFTTKPLGSGLGLSISYSIVKRHGGMLYLESTSTEGATFAFYLPAVEGKVAHTDIPIPEAPVRSNHQRILVMDDEAAIRDLTSQLLNTLGYEVTAVPDGIEAVRTYEKAQRKGENFQAVILDATIRGGMGGLATIERLRSVDPNVTAIICSGYCDEAALSRFLAYGFRSALPKPFSRRELSDALHRALEPAGC